MQPVLDDASIGKIKFRYDLLIKKYGHLRTQQMIDFTRDGLAESTTFEDGTVVMADFKTNELSVDGERIGPPADGQLDGKHLPAAQMVSAG